MDSANVARRLSAYSPHLVSANVRGRVDAGQIVIAPGTGVAGDLALGLLDAEPSRPARVLDQQRELHILSQPSYVVAALGPRDASSSVSATLPQGGLVIQPGLVAHWVAGESGVVGCLECMPSAGSAIASESGRPREFRIEGLLHDPSGRKVSVRDFVLQPIAARLRRPVLLVGATSAEAGKTTLTGRLIRQLTLKGLRIGAVKASGTGGTMDCTSHRTHGAVLALDHVDAGLITTHGDAAEVTRGLGSVLRRMEDADVDLVVVELGGDLVSAANPAILELTELRDNAIAFAVICNDAMGAFGIHTFNQSRLQYPASMFRYFTSPFRNYAGMTRRMATLGLRDTWDPNSQADLARLASELVRKVRPASEGAATVPV